MKYKEIQITQKDYWINFMLNYGLFVIKKEDRVGFS